MRTLSDPRRFRRLVAGVCLIAAPVTLLVGALLHPQIERDGAAHLAVVAESPDRYYAAHTVLLVGLVLLLFAILGLVHLLRRGAPALGHVGGGLAIIGLFGPTALVAVDGIAVTQMAQPGSSPEEMAALVDRIKESSGLAAIAGAGALALMLGMLALAYGAWRARAVQPWAAVGIAIGALVFFVGQVTDNRLIFAAAFAVYLAALGSVEWRILSESDEEWAGQPAPAAAAPAHPAPG
jgi:hypothetical protein